ncbi:DUF3810 family protein [Cryomorphaceae bacterium 1068]|nr:DUF3810 family protein [Cryomorphaceae bacterium 1068]
MKKAFKRFGGIILLGIAFILRLIFAAFPEAFEMVYFQGIFPIIRKIQYPVGAALPYSGYYLLILIAIGWLIWRVPKSLAKRKLLSFGRRLLNFCGGLTAAFLLLWGYNYVGPSLGERMSLAETKNQYDVAKLYLYVMNEAAQKRMAIKLPTDTTSVEDLEPYVDYDNLNTAVKSVLSEFGYPTATNVAIRRVKPLGALRRIGIRGIYNPYTGEANVESDAGILTGTFTAAHEIAHAYGITSEGEANLVAYIALIHSGNPIWEYSAAYALWRYTAGEVNRKLEESDRAILAEAIPMQLQIDRLAIWQRMSHAPPYFPEFSEAVNDSYLKIQGVEGGTDDYDAFVGLYLRYTNPVMD